MLTVPVRSAGDYVARTVFRGSAFGSDSVGQAGSAPLMVMPQSVMEKWRVAGSWLLALVLMMAAERLAAEWSRW